ncbi:DNA-methyltransferase [Terrihalobacillus insolitus]|uniref:DNA-methyltransferase n=1 Tax=Terrihalobacillus insolitus TaxID=2950438 RepID=UPI0023420379|nr:site-specific DNA-methyltransferase [Terrihalobacillus insolitus]MDC3414292.1 site-specific DNA-methyltransferase [Terrihalobacillus insolitus]
MKVNEILQGDSFTVLKTLPDNYIQTCITSPPYYGLRDYGVEGQIGLESSVSEYVRHLVEIFREIRGVLKDDGTLWLNLGDSYAGSGKGAWKKKDKQFHGYVPDPKSPQTKIKDSTFKPKDLMGIPWRVAFALQEDGWYLRSDVIWNKPNAMPESVTDRPTKSHEYIFLLSKSPKYYYDHEAIKEQAIYGTQDIRGSKGSFGPLQKNRRLDRPRGSFNGKYGTESFRAIRNMRNKRDVWTVSTKPYKDAHFATFPPDLIRPCILAGSRENDLVLDPFFGSGTTGIVALEHNRNFLGIELNTEYIKLAKKRLSEIQMSFI